MPTRRSWTAALLVLAWGATSVASAARIADLPSEFKVTHPDRQADMTYRGADGKAVSLASTERGRSRRVKGAGPFWLIKPPKCIYLLKARYPSMSDLASDLKRGQNTRSVECRTPAPIEVWTGQQTVTGASPDLIEIGATVMGGYWDYPGRKLIIIHRGPPKSGIPVPPPAGAECIWPQVRLGNQTVAELLAAYNVGDGSKPAHCKVKPRLWLEGKTVDLDRLDAAQFQVIATGPADNELFDPEKIRPLWVIRRKTATPSLPNFVGTKVGAVRASLRDAGLPPPVIIEDSELVDAAIDPIEPSLDEQITTAQYPKAGSDLGSGCCVVLVTAAKPPDILDPEPDSIPDQLPPFLIGASVSIATWELARNMRRRRDNSADSNDKEQEQRAERSKRIRRGQASVRARPDYGS